MLTNINQQHYSFCGPVNPLIKQHYFNPYSPFYGPAIHFVVLVNMHAFHWPIASSSTCICNLEANLQAPPEGKTKKDTQLSLAAIITHARASVSVYQYYNSWSHLTARLSVDWTTHVHTHAYGHTHMYMHTHACTHAHTHTHTSLRFPPSRLTEYPVL